MARLLRNRGPEDAVDWAVDFKQPASKDDLKLVRDTLDAKRQSELGHHVEAARILWEIAIGARHRGEKTWECMTLVHMGKVYRTLRWAVAVQLYELAAELAGSIGFDRARMMALNDLGEMRCSWGQLEEAIADLEKSLELIEPDDLQSKRDATLNLAVAHEGVEHYQDCRRLLEEVIRLDRELGHPDLQDDREHLDDIITRINEEQHEKGADR
jgi:tetratricopeptide (TPR) repeat protein